jgi:hypothetical protein
MAENPYYMNLAMKDIVPDVMRIQDEALRLKNEKADQPLKDLERNVKKMQLEEMQKTYPNMQKLVQDITGMKPDTDKATTIGSGEDRQGLTQESMKNLTPDQQAAMRQQRPEYFKQLTPQETFKQRSDIAMKAMDMARERYSNGQISFEQFTQVQDKIVGPMIKQAQEQFQAASSGAAGRAQEGAIDPKDGVVKPISQLPAGTKPTYLIEPTGNAKPLETHPIFKTERDIDAARELGIDTHSEPTPSQMKQIRLFNEAKDVRTTIAKSEARSYGSLTGQEKAQLEAWTPSVIHDAAQAYYDGVDLGQIGVPNDRSGLIKAKILKEAKSIADANGDKDWSRRNALMINKVNKEALSTANKQTTLIKSNEAAAMAEGSRILKDLSPAVPRDEVSWENWSLYLDKKLEGKPEVVKLFDAITSFTNEYARVMEGATGAAATTVSGRVTAESLVPVLLGQKALSEVIGSLIQNMEVTLAGRQGILSEAAGLSKTNKLTGSISESKKQEKKEAKPEGLPAGYKLAKDGFYYGPDPKFPNDPTKFARYNPPKKD